MTPILDPHRRLRRQAIMMLLLAATCRTGLADDGGLPRCQEPQAFLAAWWPFDENEVDVVSGLIDNRPGRRVGAPRPVQGQVGRGMEFDGVDDYVEIPASSGIDIADGDVSIELWIRTTDDRRGVRTILDKRQTSGELRDYHMWLSERFVGLQLAAGGPGRICFVGSRPIGLHEFRSTTSLAGGRWHLVAVTVDRDQPQGGRFYLEGLSAGRFDPTVRQGSLLTYQPLRVAAHCGQARLFFQGALDELSVTQRVLSPQEIESAFRSGAAGKCKDHYRSAIAVELSDAVIPKIEAAPGADSLAAVAELADPHRSYDAIAMERLFTSTGRREPLRRRFGLHRWYRIEFAPRLEAEAIACAYARQEMVTRAEPEVLFGLRWRPDDPSYDQDEFTNQWHYPDIGLEQAWEIQRGDPSIVNVNDSGIELTHPNLQANLWRIHEDTDSKGEV